MLPLVELIEQCRGAVDEVIDVAGRATIQAVLELWAQQVTAGELSQPGKKRAGEVEDEDEAPEPRIRVVQNWYEEFREREQE